MESVNCVDHDKRVTIMSLKSLYVLGMNINVFSLAFEIQYSLSTLKLNGILIQVT